MIPLRPALDDYLTMRRALGYKLQRTEKLLANFVGFVEVGAVPVVAGPPCEPRQQRWRTHRSRSGDGAELAC